MSERNERNATNPENFFAITPEDYTLSPLSLK